MADEKEIENNLTCESCGKDFSCGAGTGSCWCFEIEPVPADRLADLREKYNNCLCPDCLKYKIELLLPDCTSTES